jgi:hypothetical protein
MIIVSLFKMIINNFGKSKHKNIFAPLFVISLNNNNETIIIINENQNYNHTHYSKYERICTK